MKKHVLVALLACMLLSACATSQPVNYNWGDYSSSLYKLKKDPCDEKLQNHKQVLAQIIQGSKEQSLRVPPGVYAEYGYILVKEGKTEEGIQYLDLESQTYPESQIFIERVKMQVTKGRETKDTEQKQ